MNCTPATLDFYKFTAGVFLAWCEARGVTSPEEVTARIVRAYLAGMEGKADRTRHAHARAIKTLLKFWNVEGYISAPVRFDMPKVAKKQLPVLNAEQLREVVKACNVRDKSIVLFMADSGLRRAETIALNWQDVDMQSGLVTVKRGKGGKERSAVIGAVTRRALLAYRRTLVIRDGVLFQSRTGARLTGTGLLLVFRRLSERTGIHVTPHALRRTFVILSLRAGMDVLHLQAMLGHASVDMVGYYAQMVDDDLLQAHKQHSPIDGIF